MCERTAAACERTAAKHTCARQHNTQLGPLASNKQQTCLIQQWHAEAGNYTPRRTRTAETEAVAAAHTYSHTQAGICSQPTSSLSAAV